MLAQAPRLVEAAPAGDLLGQGVAAVGVLLEELLELRNLLVGQVPVDGLCSTSFK